MVVDTRFDFELHETSAFESICCSRVLKCSHLRYDNSRSIGICGVRISKHLTIFLDRANKPLSFTEVVIGIFIIERLESTRTIPSFGSETIHLLMHIVQSHKVEHITFSISSIEYDRENNFRITNIIFFESREVIFIHNISVTAINDTIAISGSLSPTRSTGIYLCIKIQLSKNHISNRAGHRTITHTIIEVRYTLKELTLDPFEYLFTCVLFKFHFFTIIVDRYISI